MPTIPSWLRAPDLASDYLRGAGIAAGIAETNSRLAAERNRMAMETSIRQETLKQEQLRESARLNVEKAYHDEQISVAQQRLKDAAQVNSIKTRQAAMKVAAQQKLSELVRKGVPLDKALYQVPELMTPTLINEIERQRQTHEDATRRMNLTEEGQKIARKRLDNTTGLETVRTEIPSQEAVEAVPESKGFLGIGAHPAIPGKPAVPKQTITRRQPIGSEATQPTTSPFKEGQRIRNKKTGKMFVVKDGQPVPEEEATAEQ